VCVLLIFLAWASCATPRGAPGALPDIKPGQRPPLDSDEAGLWMAMDRVEGNLRTSGRLITDPGLNAYVRDIVCKLAGPYCADIRVYVVQTPHFNATMAPNGAMEVWTGLILRAQNEAQLAYVLGHEIGHYLRRHSIQMWRDVRTKSDLLVFFNVLTAAAGVGYAGNLGQLVALGSLYAFSRDNEREADDVGFELMVNAGYDSREAAKIWEALVKEQAAAKGSTPFIFFATHPPTEERIDTLRKLAQRAVAQGGQANVGTERFGAATLPLRAALLRDELRQREFSRSQVVLDRLIEYGVGLGELYFFQGELYRLRAEKGDEAKAIAAYEKALEVGAAPTETHRALGLMFSKTGERGKARASFERYLQGRPDAEDRDMIKAQLEQLE
jgi:tetratricopeptide (TPR) repeat protein